MTDSKLLAPARLFWLAFSFIGGACGVLGLLFFGRLAATPASAAPIPPPAGYPKLNMSTKVVSPTLAHTGGAVLHYAIEIQNTGAYTADGVTFNDVLPPNIQYNGDAQASKAPAVTFSAGALNWVGQVGFDQSVLIQFSATVSPTFSGVVQNQARLTQPLIAEPITVSAETVITNYPILGVAKSSAPDKPGPNKPLTYMVKVTNTGQPAVSLPITVTDHLPANTALLNVGAYGKASGGVVIWNRTVDLATSASTVFTYSVTVGGVPSGTVISNDLYNVSSPLTGVKAGSPYTVTVINPILSIAKTISPDPPGSNRPISYTLTVLNMGSLATNLVVHDRLPAGITYVSGGSYASGVVTFNQARLDTGEFARFTFYATIGDVAGVHLLNGEYNVCSDESPCQYGPPLDSLVMGPTFVGTAALDPVAKKPGGGSNVGPVTATLTLANQGPGNALGAVARLEFGHISVTGAPPLQTVPPGQGIFSSAMSCGGNCTAFDWTGNVAVGQVITFTARDQSTIGGNEGQIYSTTLTVTDTLGITTTSPVEVGAIGHVTHKANLLPSKGAPPVIGAGQTMTYTLKVYNYGLSTTVPPYPTITDTVPLSTSVVMGSVSDGGKVITLGSQQVVSWTLPAMSTGSTLMRSFSVLVNPGLVSGTQIINSSYGTKWYDAISSTYMTNAGEPVTTTVKEIGLIDSFKTVSPPLVKPGSGNLLTYVLNVVNSSPMQLNGVSLFDQMPWQHTTYQRDAVATAGSLISDIVSLNWVGDVGPFSTQLITFTVLVDKDYQGPISNTAVINHSSLTQPVEIGATAYSTNNPVLQISKKASPDPVWTGRELLYTIEVDNLGQLATGLVITDAIPLNTTYVANSASNSGALNNGVLSWNALVLAPMEHLILTFKVIPNSGLEVINDRYGVRSLEGVAASGPPVITPINRMSVYLPMIHR